MSDCATTILKTISGSKEDGDRGSEVGTIDNIGKLMMLGNISVITNIYQAKHR